MKRSERKGAWNKDPFAAVGPRRFRGRIKHRTDKGVLFEIHGEDVWLPVSDVTEVEVNSLGEGLFEVPAKTANWKGIV